MKRLWNLATLMVVLFGLPLLLGGCGGGNTNCEIKQIPLKDFFKNPEKTGYQISPDGKYLTYLAPWETRMNIFVQEVGKTKATRLTSEKDRDINQYFWAKDRILFLKDKGGDENFKLYGISPDGSNLICFTDFDSVTTQIIDVLEDLPADDVIIGLNKRNKQIFDAYRLNIKTGEMTLIAENPGNIDMWVTDHDGKLRVASTTDGVNRSLLYRPTEKDPFQVLLTTNFKESLDALFFTFDNKNLYAASNIGRDKTAIIEYDLTNKKEIKVIYENPDYDVSNLSYSHKRKVLIAAVYTSWKRDRHFFDKEFQAMFEDIVKQVGDKVEVSISGYNKAEDKFIVRTYSDRTMGSYYLYDVSTKKLDNLCEVSSWLKEDEMAEMKPIEFKSRDGLTIHGYLTLPKCKNQTNLPVVVNPHGGPWYRDSWSFNPEVQFLANRGYAVLQLNFRGSTGYGRKFWEASFKQWGKTMNDDITDGVNWLIEQKYADKNRIAIYGASYGGYATLAGLTFSPDVYCCGVDYVGVSNLFTFMKTIPPYWKPFMEMMYTMVGDPRKDSLLMVDASPVFHVENIKAPLFIAQGANDPRVNKAESDQMVEALKKRGVEVEYMVKNNEGHGFYNEENQFDFYEAMEKFLAKHMKK
jgi:dipeptidyl aminopeptidase/acylaminoacyl peptidase